MPIKPKLAEAINDQIQAEFQSAYQYLAMAAWFEENNLSGFSHWMRLQWQEETGHAMKLFTFLHDRGGVVKLQAVNVPDTTWNSPLEVFEDVQRHEQMITERINTLYELAVTEKDLPTQVVLQWFINEQVEEEAVVDGIIDRLKLVGSDGPSIYLLNQELGSRSADGAGVTG